MEDELLSLLVWCKHDSPVNASSAASIRVVRVDTGEEVALKDGSYLVRVSQDSAAATTRCFVRHLGNGREVYFQSGQGLPSFVRTCLVQGNETPTAIPETTATPTNESEVAEAGETEADGQDGQADRNVQ